MACPEEMAGQQVSCPKCGAITLVPAQQLGNYTIVRKIGEGGMGTVYEAVQAGINRRVALKVLSAKFMNDQSFLQRFMREVQAAGALNHPNIITVYEVCQDKGSYFYSMEFVDGETLGKRLNRTGRMSAEEALGIVRKVGTALEYAWNRAKIIHRDIKPDNIMVNRQGEVKVADLGLAKSTAQDTTVTADGLGIGTPAYMSPEQSRGAKDTDCRADIYSLGITLFQMLTGHLPYKADSGFALVAAHLEQALPDPRSLNPEIPQAVCELIRRMCAKKPAQRYQTPAELIQAIDGILETGAPAAAPRTQVDEFREQQTAVATQYTRSVRESRFPVSAVLGAVLAVLLVGGAGYLVVGKRPTAPVTTTTTTTTTTVPPGVSEAQKAFEEAVAYGVAHPEDFQAIIAKFEDAKLKATKDAPLAGKAADQVKEWQAKWEAAANAEFEKRKATADSQLQAKAYDKAKAAWQGFPDSLKTETVEAKIAAELGRLKDAMKSFAEDLKKQAAPLLAKKPEQLTEDDVKALTALRAQAEQAPAGLDEEAKAALEAVKDELEAALDGYQQLLAAKRAEAFEKFWRVHEGLMKGRKFDEAAGFVEKCAEKLEAKAKAVLAKDTPLVKGLLAKARENLPQLKGKAVRIGSMMMTVSDVKDGKVYVKQEGAEMAWEMEKLDAETIFALAFGPDAAPNLVLRQKALHIFYYGAMNEAGKAMKAAAEAGEDVELYLSRMTPVLVITSSPPGAEVELEVLKDGGWQRVEAGALKTPARKEVSPNGTYRVTLAKEGYLGADREVKVGVAGESAASFILKKAPAWPPFRDGLVLYYSFDEAGDRVQDLSGKGNHGTVHGATWTAKGKVGGAYQFDGRDDFIRTPYADCLDLRENLSMVVWVCYRGEGTGNHIVLLRQSPFKYQYGLGRFCREARDARPGHFVAGLCLTKWTNLISDYAVDNGTWHHFAMTYDGRNARLYVDGRLNKAIPVTGAVTGGAGDFFVGTNPEGEYANAVVDEVMVFRRALSDAEIRSLADPNRAVRPKGASSKADLQSVLKAGFEVPTQAKDQYGSPVHQGKDEETGLPLEIRHKATGMSLVFIPAGEFLMGASPGERTWGRDERPQHRVRITRPFYLGKYEVTQKEWVTVMDGNPSKFLGDRNPVETVSWFDCQEFVKKLNEGLGGRTVAGAGQAPPAGAQQAAPLRFALPSEAQWEYACRAGTQTKYHFGDGGEPLGDYAWHCENSGQQAHPVGQKAPNPWGLFDTYGNLWEWCLEWYGPYAAGEVTNPQGPPAGTERVLRGGDWFDPGREPRSAGRHTAGPSVHFPNVGFRLAVAIPDERLHGLPVRDGLVLYYSFDEAGETVQDLSGKGNDGTVHGAKWTPNGKLGGAYQFDGKDDYIERDYDDKSDLYPTDTPFAVVAWFKTSAPLPAEPAILGSHYAPVGDGYHLILATQRLGGRIRWQVSGGFGDVSSRLPVNDGRWHQAVGIWNDGQVRLYIDGVLEGTNRTPGPIPYAHRPAFRIAHLVTAPEADSSIFHFNGTIDEVMVFDRVLSKEDVRALWEWTGNRPGGKPGAEP
jgi:serine/threonine-protein kinase